ncbi:class I SAM-dependent methyltransferase [Candidatus Halobonum tyrrellensis]|uniref:Methylase n=1 Tax=Candidatus Halobonum tyrrellensis G22 TaxID=1324957 RepID=V4HDU2_9EURY|nr:class I SAM-dependent methyltransferase [Candidatus Halobonum tyrrellensis]ESP88820.1 methylase [Candidatus Halobonum tyrrellensis G22]
MHGRGDVRFFDAVASLYDAAMPSVRPADLHAGLAFAHRPIERILDVGGGTGRAARALEGRGGEVTVVDASRGMLARAAAAGHPVVRGDAGRLPVRDGGVDAVVVADALHHFPDPRGALAECARALAPGGVVVVREFDPRTRRGRALATVERVARMGSRFLPPDDLTRALDEAGLRGRVVDPGFGYTVVGVNPTDGSRSEPRRGSAAEENPGR